MNHSKPTISLNTQSVFITQEGVLKIMHGDMLDENYRYALDHRYFYAPEKINNFNHTDSYAGVVKEAVFSMGMTVLQAALL